MTAAREGTRLTDAQFGVLCTLRECGPQDVVEIFGPRAMDGSSKTKIEGFLLSAPTLARLEKVGFVEVQRSEVYHLKNAAGKPGLARRKLHISITDAGRTALSSGQRT